VNVGDMNTSTVYANQGRRQTGFITRGVGFQSLAQSIGFVTGNGPEAGDPTSWELYGTNNPIVSGDNSAGDQEPWTLIASGNVSLPSARGTPGPLLPFVNSTPYQDYRVVFPTVKDFRAADTMEVSEVLLFSTIDGSGQNLMQFLTQLFNPPVAIQRPISEADSLPNEGAEKQLDGAPYTKYRNFGRENSGFIVTPSAGPTIVECFRITTANNFAGRDPASWALYGTNDPILSEDFSDGNAEAWTLIGSGLLTLPDARLEEGPIVNVSNVTPYLSYRLVFPSVKNNMAPGVTSLQVGDIQFYGQIVAPVEPAPEPGSLALAAAGMTTLGVAKRRRGGPSGA
jgi:hypothetical protein